MTGKERVLGHCLRCPSQADPGLVAALQKWRSAYSSDHAIPVSLVITESSLELVAASKPQSLAELAELPGFHTVKLAEIGESVLAVVLDQAAWAAEKPGTQASTSARIGTVASS